MAQRVKVELIDDLDQSVAAETLSFALDGVSYEMDLSTENASKLREALAPWVANARRVGGRRSTKQAKNTNTQQIRAWALDNGHEVSDRGRIPAEIIEAYHKAN